MKNSEEVDVKIQSDGKPVPIHLFSDYFHLLRGCYVLALEEVEFEMDGEGDVAVAEVTQEYVAEAIAHRMATLTPSEFNKKAKQALSVKEELYLNDIMRRNPFEVVFFGVAIALTAALIVSGGKFEFGLTKLKIEIPPLGEGIKKIRNAFKK